MFMEGVSSASIVLCDFTVLCLVSQTFHSIKMNYKWIKKKVIYVLIH